MHWTLCEDVTLLKPFVPPIIPGGNVTKSLRLLWLSYLTEYWKRSDLWDYEARGLGFLYDKATQTFHQDCADEDNPSGECEYLVAWSNAKPTELQTPTRERITGIHPFDVVLFRNSRLRHRAPRDTTGRWFCRARLDASDSTATQLLEWRRLDKSSIF